MDGVLTSFPVGTCLASLTLAKLPLPMVLSSLYLPMCGSSDVRLLDDETRPVDDDVSFACNNKENKILGTTYGSADSSQK